MSTKEKEEEKVETFEDVFAEAAEEPEGNKAEAGKSDEPKKEEPKEVEPKKEGEVEPKKEDEPKVEDYEQKYKSLQGMFNSEAEKRQALEEEVKKLKEPKPEEKKPEPKPEEDKPDPELDEYLKEYDTIAKNESKLRKKELAALKTEIKKEMAEELGVPFRKIEELLNTRDEEAELTHVASILDAHEDYGIAFDRPQVEEWISKLSPLKKREYGAILGEGSTEEVVELLTEYKKANNISLKKEEESDTTNQEEDEEKEKKLKSMEAVKHKKTPVGDTANKKEDYEGAFDEAAKKKD
jgi:hypothetical protein